MQPLKFRKIVDNPCIMSFPHAKLINRAACLTAVPGFSCFLILNFCFSVFLYFFVYACLILDLQRFMEERKRKLLFDGNRISIWQVEKLPEMDDGNASKPSEYT